MRRSAGIQRDQYQLGGDLTRGVHSGYVIAVGNTNLGASFYAELSQLGFLWQVFTQASEAFARDWDSAPIAVVTAYRLPDTDGISLLSRVARLWPNAIRVLLRSDCDRDWLDESVLEGSISVCLDSRDVVPVLVPYLADVLVDLPVDKRGH